MKQGEDPSSGLILSKLHRARSLLHQLETATTGDFEDSASYCRAIAEAEAAAETVAKVQEECRAHAEATHAELLQKTRRLCLMMGEGLADTSNVHLEEMEEELDMVLQRLQMSLLKRQLGHREQSEPAEKSRSVSAYLKEAAKDLPNPGEPTSVYPPGHCQLLLQSIEKLLGEVKLPLGQAAARHERAKADYTVAADSLREKKDLYAAELQNLAGLEDGLDEKVKALRHFSGEAQELTESDLAESIATVKRALRRLSHEQAFREARSEMRRQCLLQKRLDYSGHYTETHGATPRSGPAVSSTPIIGYRAAA
eukprot:GHVT01094005.1.p1 GENE.GHVT01094005.1~~GHVT01094005.1.p1  ORF type:complete len:311 (-),score=61.13 GHVT01094005.1:496-1428(-)